MRNKTLFSFLFLATCWLLLFSPKVMATTALSNTQSMSRTDTYSLSDFVHGTNKELQEKLNKKLSWKEKLALSIMRRKLAKAIKANPELANTSMDYFLAPCPKIVLKNGDIIEADIIQITPTEVKYKRCGKPSDPEIILNKKDILSIIPHCVRICAKRDKKRASRVRFTSTKTKPKCLPSTSARPTLST